MAAFISAELLRELTPWPELIEAIAAAFRAPCAAPPRLHYEIPVAGTESGTLLLMPAWQPDQMLGVKIVQIFPGNARLGTPAVHGLYMLASAIDGHVQAILDAQELTARRTAATSALASRFLSRPDSRRLLIMGTGRLALNMAAAHAAVRPIRHVAIWGRNPDKAQVVAARVRNDLGIDAASVADLPAAIGEADIISTVTTSASPILQGRLLKTGTHVDLVGGFTPRMREADDAVIRAARIYVDALQTAPREAGDLSDPIARGVIHATDLEGDLIQLCQGRITPAHMPGQTTVFKSVGVALEDLAAATLAWKVLQSRPGGSQVSDAAHRDPGDRERAHD
jgi:ornithine cyclodeaminase